MGQNIQVFNHEMFGNIRTLTTEKGETFFVGKDVAKALGYAKPENALATHVEKEDKTTTLIQGTGSNYKSKTVLINESGLYALILSSKLEQARAFKRWVTSEVLPQIRQTGGYIPTRNMRTGERLSEGKVLYLAQNILQRTIAQKNLPADDCMTTTEIARSMGVTTKELNQRLVKLGVQYRKDGRYWLQGQYGHLDYAQERDYHYYGLNGEKKERKYLVWTKQGKKFIEQLICMN